MRHGLVLALIICAGVNAAAEERGFGNFSGCGLYEAAGTVALEQGRFVLRVFPRTLSETRLALPDSFQLKAAPFLDRAVSVRGQIVEPPRAYRGSLEPRSIVERVPDPLRPERDSGFRLIERQNCR